MAPQQSLKPTIVHLSTYPPRACGLATYTADVVSACGDLCGRSLQHLVVAMEDAPRPRRYGKEVTDVIRAEDPESYRAAALRLNVRPEVVLVSIQHEYGIFGGPFGNHLFLFLDALEKPYVVTLHTVLPEPSEEQRAVIQGLGQRAARLVVMTENARTLVAERYGVQPEKIAIIPHGIHQRSFVSVEAGKKKRGLEDRLVLSTFGLLSPGKGIEYVIEALPPLVSKYPDLVYLILGATHPVVAAREGERYREELKRLVRRLHLTEHVVFQNRYMKLEELLSWLEATDVYVSPGLDPHQAVSGTLSYALGSGRPVVSTAFAQARELLAPGRDMGFTVPFRNSPAYVSSLDTLLADRAMRERFGYEAYFQTRSATWPNVALQYLALWSTLNPDLGKLPFALPAPALRHLDRLTDGHGVIQFSKLSVPDEQSGYTADDNARALIVALEAKTNGIPGADRIAERAFRYLEGSFRPGQGFVNLASRTEADRLLYEETSMSQDAHGRSIAALGYASTVPSALREEAVQLFRETLPVAEQLTELRAVGFTVIGLWHWLTVHPEDERAKAALRRGAELLKTAWQEHASSWWSWFSPLLTYSNATLPHALLLAGEALGDERASEIARHAIDFLIGHSFVEDHLVPIGQNGWFRKGGHRQYFDQQPEEASALSLALAAFYEKTGDAKYQVLSRRALEWFLGRNATHQTMYDRSSGGSYDGLRVDGVNLNQGSESTVCYLLARFSFEKKLRAQGAVFSVPPLRGRSR